MPDEVVAEEREHMEAVRRKIRKQVLKVLLLMSIDA
jgi:hypothetical protein